ncbi:MAG TPA: endonuclease/exonuclease/phosphatase family protein [Pyrinomonadaceae bacterium]|nr:endonuclease/exonuclease/phosphatase family protein [Pyrinomonadaceae bacterium]
MITANLQHGQNTATAYDFAGQARLLASLADVVSAQEVSPGDLPNWDAAFAELGFNRTLYVANSTQINDGQVIWYRTATVTVNNTYSHNLSSGFISFDGSTSVDKSAVAIDVTVEDKRALIVDTHLCWSKCADSSADIETGKSWQRDAQARELNSWIASLGYRSIILAGDFDMTPLFPQYPLFSDYVDAWKLGLQLGAATAAWSDRDGDGVSDMTLGDLTTRTHDTRRIDYVFLQGSVGLVAIDLPDLRKPCELVNGQCPAVSQRWGITDDLGVRPSDHNWLRATVTLY